VYNAWPVLRNLPIIEVLAALIGRLVDLVVTSPENERQQSFNRASTERQRIRLLHLAQSKGGAAALTHNRSSGHHYKQYLECRCRCTWKWASPEHQQSIDTASTECQQSVNDSGCCILYNPKAVVRHLSMIEVLATWLWIMVRVDIATPNNKCHQSHNRELTILGIASCIIQGLCYGIYP